MKLGRVRFLDISNIQTLTFNLSTPRQLIFPVFLVFIGLLLAFGDYLGISPITIIGIKFYGADFILIIIALMLMLYGLTAPFRTHLALLLLLFMLFGFLSMLYGYLEGHELKAAIGDFRRLFFYTTAYGVTWRLLDTPKRLFKINNLAYIAVIPVIVLSTLRVWKGISWHPKFSDEDMRAVSYATVTVLFWVFYDAASRLIFKRHKLVGTKYIIWVIMVGFAFLISNYRLLWVLPLAGGVGLIWFSWQKGHIRLTRILYTFFLIVGAILLSIMLLKLTQNQMYLLIEQKFIEKVLNFQFINSFRYFVWRAVWEQFRDNWLVGVGLGHRLEYELLNSAGEFYTRISTTHNIILEIFYQTGIIGGILFAIPHAWFLIYVWRHLHKLPYQWARPTLALFITYLSMLLLGLFQPFLTVPSVAVSLYVVMGVTARYVYWGRRSNSEEEVILENRPV